MYVFKKSLTIFIFCRRFSKISMHRNRVNILWEMAMEILLKFKMAIRLFILNLSKRLQNMTARINHREGLF